MDRILLLPQELYNFKKENPNVDLAPFLEKSTPFFRDYIERKLREEALLACDSQALKGS